VFIKAKTFALAMERNARPVTQKAIRRGKQSPAKLQNEFTKRRKRAFGQDCSKPKKTQNLPLILLDVDGVINRFVTNKKIWMDEMEVAVNCGGDSYRSIRYSPTVVAALNQIFETGLAEIRWLTYWNQEAQEYLAPQLGLRHFEMGNDLRYTDKGPAAKEWAILHPERPIVWIDDEISMHSFCDSEFWATRPKTMLIAPKDHLSSEHLGTLTEFLRMHAQH
jgi:hypothetical protein